METRNNIEGINVNSSIIQFYNSLESETDNYTNTKNSEIINTAEIIEGAYCPLPEYCLIEDKWKYLAGIL